MTGTTPDEPSNYMQTLTRYLSNIMNSTLLGLPREIKELIYFDALSHAANKILALPLSPDVKKINHNGVGALAMDVKHLTDFVDGLENGFMLRSNLDELEQTILLLQSDNTDEFFDVSTRNKKYGRVDAMNGPILLEKYVLRILPLSIMSRPSSEPSADFHRSQIDHAGRHYWFGSWAAFRQLFVQAPIQHEIVILSVSTVLSTSAWEAPRVSDFWNTSHDLSLIALTGFTCSIEQRLPDSTCRNNRRKEDTHLMNGY